MAMPVERIIGLCLDAIYFIMKSIMQEIEKKYGECINMEITETIQKNKEDKIEKDNSTNEDRAN